jgi:polyhydroxybutyrate depolymerase
MFVLRQARTFALTLVLACAVAPAASASFPNPWPGNVQCVSTKGLGHTFRTGANCRQFRFGGYDRRYVAYVPLSAKLRMARHVRVPVVAMLHGSSGTGEEFFNHSGWQEIARREGFIAVFPTGLEYWVDTQGPIHLSTKWADYNLLDDIDETHTPPAGGIAPADDVGFLRAVAGDVASSARVDRRRVYLSGFSNGGAMCLRAALELSGRLAAVGCNAGSLHAVHPVTAGQPHIPVVLTIGSLDDRFITALHDAGADPSLSELPMNAADLFQLPGVPSFVSTHTASFDLTDQANVRLNGPRVVNVRYDDPAAGAPAGTSQLQLMVLKGVEHEYPTATNNPPRNFKMAEILWAFFRAHPKP